MVDNGHLLALVRHFVAAKDECCLANLLDDVHPDDRTRLISELGPDDRAVVVRVLARRRALETEAGTLGTGGG